MTQASRIRPVRFRSLLAATALAASLLLASGPAFASVERARAAQQQGDLRGAQIEYRNAVRDNPDSGEIRAALARASLDVGDTDTAEKEARAAIDRGYDRAAGTALLMRAYLARGRFQDLLREFPEPDAQMPPAVAGEIAAGRAMAQIGMDRKEDARASVATAVRLAPQLVEPHLAAFALAVVDRDRAAAEAAVDKALAIDGDNIEALMRKAALQADRREMRPAIETLGKVVSQMPGNVQARVRRGELLFRLGDDAAAKQDVDAALRTAPGSTVAMYLRAMLQGRARDWQGADETLTRIGANITNFPDGLLLLAATKQALGQTAQAEDAARRYVARRPDDVRGAKLLASMDLAAGRADDAAATLDRVARGGTADAESLEMLARAHAAMGRTGAAVAALEKASELAPDNAALKARLAAARMSAGESAKAAEAAEAAMRLDKALEPAMRQILAAAAMSRGDLAEASAELERAGPAARDSEVAGVLDGTIHLVRVDAAGARQRFEAVLAKHPDSIHARLGLARAAAMQGKADEVNTLLGEVLARAPANQEAIARLTAGALSGGPRGDAVRETLLKAQAAKPTEPALARAAAVVLLAHREPAKAAEILDAEPLKAQRNATLLMLLAEARAAEEKWSEAEEASRAALAQEPENVMAQRQLSALLTRRGEKRAAEDLLQRGLTTQPGNAVLQQTLVDLIKQDRGLDAALAQADRLAATPRARPASLSLRGDLLMGEKRFEEAAQAFGAAYEGAPSRDLAMRRANALLALRKPDDAAAALNEWLAKQPDDPVAEAQLAQIDLAQGRTEEAERRLKQVVATAPGDGVSLNNLAWLMQESSDPSTPAGQARLAEARLLAERGYYLNPSAESSDTLGWILARSGKVQEALPLMRQAAAVSAARRRIDPSIFYRLAYTLRAAGEKEEARKVIEPVVATDVAFPEREAATKMLNELRAGG